MTTTLIVEDGTGIPNANTYVSLADAQTYLTMRGLPVPSDDVLTSQLINGMDYLGLKGWVGVPEFDTQALDWPRVASRRCRCQRVPVGIPQKLIQAQCRLTYDAAQIGDLMPTQSGPFVIMEKVDVLETQYSQTINTDGSPTFPMVDALLSGLIDFESNVSLRTFRM